MASSPTMPVAHLLAGTGRALDAAVILAALIALGLVADAARCVAGAPCPAAPWA